MTDFRAKLTIFDLDKTLAFCNVSFVFGRYLYKTGRLSFRHMLFLVCAYFLHKIHILSVGRLHQCAFGSVFSKKSEAEVARLVQEFLHVHGDSLFRDEVKKRLEQVQKEGGIVWIQSSSPFCIVKPIADLLGVSLVTATRYGLDSLGLYSHVVEVVQGSTKKRMLDAYAKEHKISLQEVTAYSDSRLDIPLLQAVGTPIAVCPDRKLQKLAHKHSWQVLQL